jgi:hypothetical protein
MSQSRPTTSWCSTFPCLLSLCTLLCSHRQDPAFCYIYTGRALSRLIRVLVSCMFDSCIHKETRGPVVQLHGLLQKITHTNLTLLVRYTTLPTVRSGRMWRHHPVTLDIGDIASTPSFADRTRVNLSDGKPLLTRPRSSSFET